MDPADWHREFIADPAGERAWLREANVMRFGGRTATYDAGSVATNLQCSLSRKRMVFAATRRRRTTAVSGAGVSGASKAWLCPSGSSALGTLDSFRRRITPLSSFDRREPLPEGALNKFSVGRGQRVLDGKVLVDPVGGLGRGFEIAQFRDQSAAQRL